jgi:putative ABC transport system ATP-binding protein
LNRAGLTIVLVTHESDIAAHAGRIITFRDGRVLSDVPVREPADAAAVLTRTEARDDEAVVEEAVVA